MPDGQTICPCGAQKAPGDCWSCGEPGRSQRAARHRELREQKK